MYYKHSIMRVAPLLLAILFGCGSTPPPDPWYPRSVGPSSVPTSEAEAIILEQLGTLEGEGTLSHSDVQVIAGAPYFAASERLCRRLIVESREGVSEKLACDGTDGWQLSADVFEAPRGR